MSPPSSPPSPLFRRRVFTPIFLVRQWQIEKNRHEHEGEFEEPLVTVERLKKLRSLVHECFPSAQVSWALSRGAILETSTHWCKVRDVLASFADEFGDEIMPQPCAGYTVLHNPSSVVEEELDELFEAIARWRGAPPRAIQAWVLLSRSIQYVHQRWGLDAVSGHCFSQSAVDGMSMEGSVPYPYYPSKHHFLIPAADEASQVDVPMLDVISLDLITARGSRKKVGRARRMGLQLLETVNWKKVGPVAGLKALKAISATYLEHNRDNLPFSWITSTQEVIECFRHEHSFPAYQEWMRWLADRYPDLELRSTPQFGRDFRASFATNTWRYHLHSQGTGVPFSDPEEQIDWVFCKDYRAATLLRPKLGRTRPKLIDYVDYRRQSHEPEGPCNDASLHASPWMKNS